jgi:hypothetical protein
VTTECAATIETPNERDIPPLIMIPARISGWRRVFRSFWMRLCLLVFIFSAGGVTGYCVGSILMEQKYVGIMKEPRPRADSVMKYFKSNLELTEDQCPEVEKIIRRHHESLEKIRRQVAPMYLAEFDHMDQEMRGVLGNSHQQELWKKRATGMREWWANGRAAGRDRNKRRGEGDQRPKERKSESSEKPQHNSEFGSRSDPEKKSTGSESSK